MLSAGRACIYASCQIVRAHRRPKREIIGDSKTMRIRYAVSTMVFWWRENHLSFEQECDFLRSLGFGIELWPTMKGNNDCRYIKRNWMRLKHATEGMLVALHSRNDGPTLKEWAEQIECSEMLGAPIVADLRSLCVSEEFGIADWDFAQEVIKMCQEHSVELCLETGSLAALLQVGDKFDHVRFCLDTGYANIDEERSFKEYVDLLSERITYIHLADNYGKFDDHEPPGVRGGMARENWDYLLEKISAYDNDVIASFEMFPAMPGTMIKQGGNFLFKVLKWPEKPEPQPGADETTYRPI